MWPALIFRIANLGGACVRTRSVGIRESLLQPLYSLTLFWSGRFVDGILVPEESNTVASWRRSAILVRTSDCGIRSCSRAQIVIPAMHEGGPLGIVEMRRHFRLATCPRNHGPFVAIDGGTIHQETLNLRKAGSQRGQDHESFHIDIAPVPDRLRIRATGHTAAAILRLRVRPARARRRRAGGRAD